MLNDDLCDVRAQAVMAYFNMASRLLEKLSKETKSIKITTVFWNVASCSLVEINRRFRGAYCLRHRPDLGSKHL
jgi:hypothetical protein